MKISSGTRSKLKQIESISLFLDLPEEVHDEIFLKLPAKSILVSRCVCKLFYNLLSKPNFIKNHLNLTVQTKINNPKLLFSHYSRGKHPTIYSIPIDYASISSSSSVTSSLLCECDGAVLINYPFESKEMNYLEFLGSLNGLICSRISKTDRVAYEKGYFLETDYFSILNPLTREFKEFTKPEYSYDAVYGFGYDSNIDDYKLVVISDYVKTHCFKVDVYTVKLDSWSSIQGTRNYSFGNGGKESHGVFFNGCLHWLGSIATGETSSEVIVSFDVSSESMVDMPVPENIMPPRDYRGEMYANVGVWGDCIGITFIWRIERIDVWVMQEYGVKESWIKKYTTTTTRLPRPLYPYWKPLWCFDNGEILVDNSPKHLFLCDPAKGRVKSVVVRDITKANNRESYVESIVSLNSGTYLEKRVTQGIE
ncbi:F-box/kelch-repeat protein At3g23880-like [Papaver somniferum]|uniref:F-box/kelch-repeat protein At3g23880-like n=1 Tax=Papaver somniferum TaxID=3469 RepID=UPI000E6F63C6|nr:F-box/kelch-repeat protein At3g23880-like [Papaver somniferum]